MLKEIKQLGTVSSFAGVSTYQHSIFFLNTAVHLKDLAHVCILIGVIGANE